MNGRSDRVVPDISADADEDSGLLEGVIELNAKGVPGHYQQFPVGGTSLASPLVAGMVADAQQGQATSFGFINPLLYSLAGTGAFNDTLPVTPSSPTYEQSSFVPAKIVGVPTLETIDTQDPAWTGQVTAPGYDTMTGLGTPNGAAFINGLRSGS